MIYSIEECELVHNKEFKYFILYINGKCQFNDFLHLIKQSKKEDPKAMNSLIALMDAYSKNILLPRKKFNTTHVTPARDDVFEFKKDHLRIYVVIQDPYVYIVMGGYKNNQKKDIATLGQRLKGFNTNYQHEKI